MNPTETVLLGFVLALALVGVAYWMGRRLPSRQSSPAQPAPPRSAVRMNAAWRANTAVEPQRGQRAR